MSKHVVSHTYPDTTWSSTGVRYLSQRFLAKCHDFGCFGFMIRCTPINPSKFLSYRQLSLPGSREPSSADDEEQGEIAVGFRS